MYLSYCLNTQGSITNTSYDKKILFKVQIYIPEGWQSVHKLNTALF